MGPGTGPIVASLIGTAKPNGVEPFACLKDVIEPVVSGRTTSGQLGTLLPWAWNAARLAAAVDA